MARPARRKAAAGVKSIDGDDKKGEKKEDEVKNKNGDKKKDNIDKKSDKNDKEDKKEDNVLVSDRPARATRKAATAWEVLIPRPRIGSPSIAAVSNDEKMSDDVSDQKRDDKKKKIDDVSNKKSDGDKTSGHEVKTVRRGRKRGAEEVEKEVAASGRKTSRPTARQGRGIEEEDAVVRDATKPTPAKKPRKDKGPAVRFSLAMC